MRPVWLIEAGVYGAEADPLLAEIRRQGMTGEVVPHQSLKKGSAPVIEGEPLAPEACVIGYGTFPFARQIQLHHPWVPGAWCNAENLDCSVYFAHFEKFLLNQHHAILPGIEAIRQVDSLFSKFGNNDEVFARPTSCHKLFVGRRITRDSFATALAPTRYDPESLVVIAAPKPLGTEWRLVVIGDRVIAASQYARSGTRDITPGCPEEVRSFSERMLSEVRWRPDPIFMMDICESEGRLWLVELNSFSCSWLYRCDLTAVVAEASELARQAWTRSHL
ncbi:MAG TPA: ATP-grasp domain-containing protein [Gemmataceae bacterium]|nr:ATP-grasp domain-containing protein [Gemmataceae bacterium]